MEAVSFTVRCGKLVPKPRMTQSDRWKKRDVVQRWLVFKDLIALTYRRSGGITFADPVVIEYKFYVDGTRRMDIDNLIKGINDALNGLAFIDDNIKRVRHIDGAFVFFIPKGEEERAEVRIWKLKRWEEENVLA